MCAQARVQFHESLWLGEAGILPNRKGVKPDSKVDQRTRLSDERIRTR
jgi:hypothetical protein